MCFTVEITSRVEGWGDQILQRGVELKDSESFRGSCQEISEIYLDFEPCVKVHSLISVQDKSIKLVKLSFLTWSFLWWCQIIDWIKIETRPSFLRNLEMTYITNNTIWIYWLDVSLASILIHFQKLLKGRDKPKLRRFPPSLNEYVSSGKLYHSTSLRFIVSRMQPKGPRVKIDNIKIGRFCMGNQPRFAQIWMVET